VNSAALELERAGSTEPPEAEDDTAS
jgi:hypothetical protein